MLSKLLSRFNQYEINFAAAVCLISAVWLCFTDYSIVGIFFGVLVALLSSETSRRRYLSKIRALAFDSFIEMDILQGGQRYIGAESRIITRLSSEAVSQTGSIYTCTILEKFLAKTKKGQWFVYGVYTCKKRVVDVEIRPMTDEDAAMFLQRDLNLYKQYFGEPEIA